MLKRTPVIWGAALACGAFIGWGDRAGETDALARSALEQVRIETWTGQTAAAIESAGDDGALASVLRRMRRDMAVNGVEESASPQTRSALIEHTRFALAQIEDATPGTEVSAGDVKTLAGAVRALGRSAGEAHHFEPKSTFGRWAATIGLGLGLGWVGWGFFGPSGIESEPEGEDAKRTHA